MGKGGARPNTGRPKTGRERLVLYVTNDEAKALKDLLNTMRDEGHYNAPKYDDVIQGILDDIALIKSIVMPNTVLSMGAESPLITRHDNAQQSMNAEESRDSLNTDTEKHGNASKPKRVNKPPKYAEEHCVPISEDDFETIVYTMRTEKPQPSWGKVTEHLNSQWCNDDRTVFHQETVRVRGNKIMEKLEDK